MSKEENQPRGVDGKESQTWSQKQEKQRKLWSVVTLILGCALALALFNFFRQGHSSSKGSNKLVGKRRNGSKRMVWPGEVGECWGVQVCKTGCFNCTMRPRENIVFSCGVKKEKCTLPLCSIVQRGFPTRKPISLYHKTQISFKARHFPPPPKIADKCGCWEFSVSDPRCRYHRYFLCSRLQGELEGNTRGRYFSPFANS